MKFFLSFGTLTITLFLLSSTTAKATVNVNVEQVLKANQDFTINLYKHLAQKEGNIFFSPISIHAVLSMAFQGARGSTAQKLATTLKITSAENSADGYSSILNRINSVNNVTLLMANKIYLMEGKSFKANFKTIVEKHFLSKIEQVNFTKNVEAANTINKWVQEQTKHKINQLISKDDLNEFTRFVMLNAVYFKGDWLEKFDKTETKDDSFFVTNDNQVQVKMMNLVQELYYTNSYELDSQIVRLPYLNRDISMFIVLPNRIDGIKELEAKLARTAFSEITDFMFKAQVTLQLPRFKIEHTLNNLEEILTKLGLGEIFIKTANFSGIMETEPTYVSKIIQKSFIEVNEEGSEAAISTALDGFTLFSGPLLVTVRVDHPFMLFITEENDNVLFAGRVSNPLQNE